MHTLSGVVVGSAAAAAVAQAAAAAAAAAAAGQSAGAVQNQLELGQVQHTPGAVPASVTGANATNTITGNSNRSQHGGGHQNNSGVCQICNKSFRQLRSHIQDVHNPTATPCPLCGKVFQSKHKMFGHKYRSCPNRTRNLVRHLEDIEPSGVSATAVSTPTTAGGTIQAQPGQTPQQVAVSASAPQQAHPGQHAQQTASHQPQPPPF